MGAGRLLPSFVVVVGALVGLLAPAGRAQKDDVSSECTFRIPDPGAPPVRSVAPAGALPGSQSLELARPPLEADVVPRNAVFRLGGDVAGLARGLWQVRFVQRDVLLPTTIDGDRVVVDDLAPGPLRVTVTTSATHPCPECFGPVTRELFVTDDDDERPPVLRDVRVESFILPPLDLQQRCNQGFGTDDVVTVVATVDEPVLLRVFARADRVDPRVLFDNGLALVGRAALAVGANFASLAPADRVVVVLAHEDLAGNVGDPVVVRVRRRPPGSVDPAVLTLDELPPRICTLPSVPDVAVPARLPRNPRIRVVFPLEDLPLAVQPADGGAAVPLVPDAAFTDDGRGGRFFAPAVPLPAGAWDVVPLPCPRCLCPTCTAPLRTRVELTDVVDAAPPAEPTVRGLIDDADPDPADGACHPDRPATLVALAPGSDDVAGSADLVYDAVVTDEDGLRRPVGDGLLPLRRANGDLAVRVPTATVGRFVGSSMRLELVARDTAGNASAPVSVDGVPGAAMAGCAAGPSSGALLALATVLGFRRRRRAAGAPTSTSSVAVKRARPG
jgi:hypothetical protein